MNRSIPPLYLTPVPVSVRLHSTLKGAFSCRASHANTGVPLHAARCELSHHGGRCGSAHLAILDALPRSSAGDHTPAADTRARSRRRYVRHMGLRALYVRPGEHRHDVRRFVVVSHVLRVGLLASEIWIDLTRRGSAVLIAALVPFIGSSNETPLRRAGVPYPHSQGVIPQRCHLFLTLAA